jgi:hypothetical protein
MWGWFRSRRQTESRPHVDAIASTAKVPGTEEFWRRVNGPGLAQGDLLPACLVPVHSAPAAKPDEIVDVVIDISNLLVVTQSCDLDQNKVRFVAMCPVYSLEEFEIVNADFRKKGKWEEVRKGRVEGLHMLPSPEFPGDNRKSIVVDFRHVISLPIEYLCGHADSLGHRWRLQSPFLEHFSQAFARFFMRVGLPSAIAPFK